MNFVFQDLHKEINLEVDGKQIELPPIEGSFILFLHSSVCSSYSFVPSIPSFFCVFIPFFRPCGNLIPLYIYPIPAPVRSLFIIPFLRSFHSSIRSIPLCVRLIRPSIPVGVRSMLSLSDGPRMIFILMKNYDFRFLNVIDVRHVCSSFLTWKSQWWHLWMKLLLQFWWNFPSLMVIWSDLPYFMPVVKTTQSYSVLGQA